MYELTGDGQAAGTPVGNPRTRAQHYTARHRQHEESGEGDDDGVVEEEFKYAKRKRKKYARYRKLESREEAFEEEEGEDEEFEDGTEGGEDMTQDQQTMELGGGHYPSSSSSVFTTTNGGYPETLYSVKWYKDNEEFYRYVPKAKTPQSSYPVEGIRVDVSRLFCLMLQNGSARCFPRFSFFYYFW